MRSRRHRHDGYANRRHGGDGYRSAYERDPGRGGEAPPPPPRGPHEADQDQHQHRGPWANGPDPRRMYRDRERGVLAGVCAGIADYFGFSLTGTRIVTVLAAFPLFPWVIAGYIALAILLPPKPRQPLYRDQEEEQFWRSVRRSPIATLSQVRHKFREMEARMQRMERYVTSKHFHLDRDFRELER